MFAGSARKRASWASPTASNASPTAQTADADRAEHVAAAVERGRELQRQRDDPHQQPLEPEDDHEARQLEAREALAHRLVAVVLAVAEVAPREVEREPEPPGGRQQREHEPPAGELAGERGRPADDDEAEPPERIHDRRVAQAQADEPEREHQPGDHGRVEEQDLAGAHAAAPWAPIQSSTSCQRFQSQAVRASRPSGIESAA